MCAPGGASAVCADPPSSPSLLTKRRCRCRAQRHPARLVVSHVLDRGSGQRALYSGVIYSRERTCQSIGLSKRGAGNRGASSPTLRTSPRLHRPRNRVITSSLSISARCLPRSSTHRTTRSSARRSRDASSPGTAVLCGSSVTKRTRSSASQSPSSSRQGSTPKSSRSSPS